MTKIYNFIRRASVVALLAVVVGFGAMAMNAGVSLVSDSPAIAQTNGQVPGNVSGSSSESDMWKRIRRGEGGVIGSAGENWRNFKNGPLTTYGSYALLGIVVILILFYVVRGRIKIDHGADPHGRTIERFNALERAVHWLTATSFIVLAVTGLNVLYGRYFLKDMIGAKAFGTLTYYGKLGHNYIAFAFMLGIALMFLLWVRHNIPNIRDIKWIMVAGGLFSSGVHPEAERFNAGQKIIFWSVILGGFSLSLSGVALMWPGDVLPWAGTFAFLNNFGLSLPTEFTPLQENQISVIWHSVVALVMIVIVIAHIYIGSIGMEGAFDAVGSGQVDINWAKEHHSLWVEEEQQKGQGQAHPAE